MARGSSLERWLRPVAVIAAPLTVAGMMFTSVPAAARERQAPPATGLTLAQAPQALQAAVRRALSPGSAPAAPIEQAELTPSDGIGFDFGWSVAISGSTAVVGDPHCLHTGCPGGAYVFARSGSIWTEQAKLTASDGQNGDEAVRWPSPARPWWWVRPAGTPSRGRPTCS